MVEYKQFYSTVTVTTQYLDVILYFYEIKLSGGAECVLSFK